MGEWKEGIFVTGMEPKISSRPLLQDKQQKI